MVRFILKILAKECKRMRGAKCLVSIEYMDLKTSNRGTAAEWFDV